MDGLLQNRYQQSRINALLDGGKDENKKLTIYLMSLAGLLFSSCEREGILDLAVVDIGVPFPHRCQ